MARTKYWLVDEVQASVQKESGSNAALGSSTRGLVMAVQSTIEALEDTIEKLRERVARLEKKGKDDK